MSIRDKSLADHDARFCEYVLNGRMSNQEGPIMKLRPSKFVMPGSTFCRCIGPQAVSLSNPLREHARAGRSMFPMGVAVVLAVALATLGLRLLWERPGAGPAAVMRSGVPTPVARVTPSATAAPVYRALLIGINSYDPAGGSGWQSLKSARPDAEAMAATLQHDYGFQVHTLLDAQATRAAIISALDELSSASGENDALLVYFAGHGYYDEQIKEGYWIPADARRTASGRAPREDWLWNSTLTRLFAAANARHVLVLADACYGGALFRGDQPLSANGTRNWYERAFAKRSRYLITSGGMEPVLDNVGVHSVFAQQLLNYLQASGHDLFSANDLGLAVRQKVAALTGQMVQMGPLPVSEHADGEFVFVRSNVPGLRPAKTDVATIDDRNTPFRGTNASALPPSSSREASCEALGLLQAGAPKTANQMACALLQQNAQDRLTQTLAAYISRVTRPDAAEELQALLRQSEAYYRTHTNAVAGRLAARPRVLACLGPSVPASVPLSDSALLYRVLLASELGSRGVARIVEREGLAAVLQEQQVNVTDLADPRARLAISKLLPASVLLLGDLIPSPKGELLALRLVDTESGEILANIQTDVPAGSDISAICAELANRVAERLRVLKPLQAPVTQVDGMRLCAAFGTFQGGRTGQVLRVVTRMVRDKTDPDDYKEQDVGRATVQTISDLAAELDVCWTVGTPPATTSNLWVRE